MGVPSTLENEATTREPSRVAQSERIERLFREHNEALVRFLLARLRSRQAALEVAQEAYVRLLSLDQPGAVAENNIMGWIGSLQAASGIHADIESNQIVLRQQ